MAKQIDFERTLQRLCDPFPPGDIEWRQLRAGKSGSGIWCIVAAYVTNRAIMQRLDAVVGPTGWRNEFRESPNGGGVLCGVSVLVDGQWVTKWDGAEYSPSNEVDPVKTSLSNAMKRAAVHWGIGRYLYGLGEIFAEIAPDNAPRRPTVRTGMLKDKTRFRWIVPTLPKWALPLIDHTYIESQAAAAQDMSRADVLKLARSVADDRSLCELTREHCLDRLRTIYKEKGDGGSGGEAGTADNERDPGCDRACPDEAGAGGDREADQGNAAE